VSADEASLNVVRSAAGVWNLDPLLRTAAGQRAGNGALQDIKLPYLEATNSRINIKKGAEKLPFSLVNTDFSFGQEKAGDWRIRLRGQPVRTDVSLDMADTGVVELEARVRRAPELRQMPVHLDLQWREAQLGQLSRLMVGNDPGWRGDLKGELHLDGTAEAAQIRTRLRATGVHRAEFTPAVPMDFDANCGFVYHYSRRALEQLACDSPLGSGRIRLTGDMPGQGGLPHLSVEMDRIPVAAGLDALRTVRSGFGSGLEAKGTVSGKLTYVKAAAENSAPEKPAQRGKGRPSHESQAAQEPLTGSLTVEGLQVSGGGLSQPIQASKVVLEPVAAAPGHPQAVAGTVAIPAGGAVPLTVTLRLGLYGYQATARGQASVARGRELAHAAGMAEARVLDALAGEPMTVDLSAEGPWLPAQESSFSDVPLGGAAAGPAQAKPAAEAAARPSVDSLSGSVSFHNVTWKADYLANRVEIAEATVHLDKSGSKGETRWDPVVFSYGPVKGTASVTLPASCGTPGLCPAQFTPTFKVQFGSLDAAALEAAVLGAQEKGTLLSALLKRLRPSDSSSAAASWPQLEGTVQADSLILGPVTLRGASAGVRIVPTGAEITGLDADLLGGRVHGDGTLRKGDKPAYAFTCHFEKLSPAAVGQLVNQRWSGKTFDADGKVNLSGYTEKDLAGSAKGTLHFEWKRGSVGGSAPAALNRFGRWSGDAEIANGKVTLGRNEALQGARKRAVEGGLTLGGPVKAGFTAPQEAGTGKR
jgi:AsmA protein